MELSGTGNFQGLSWQRPWDHVMCGTYVISNFVGNTAVNSATQIPQTCYVTVMTWTTSRKDVPLLCLLKSVLIPQAWFMLACRICSEPNGVGFASMCSPLSTDVMSRLTLPALGARTIQAGIFVGKDLLAFGRYHLTWTKNDSQTDTEV